MSGKLLDMPDIFGTVVKSEISEAPNMEKLLSDAVRIPSRLPINFIDPSLSSDDDDTDDEIDVDGFGGGGCGGSSSFDTTSSRAVAANFSLAIVLDIREPLTKLRQEAEAETGTDLSQHHIYLQGSQRLSPDSTLVERCLQGEGAVEVKVEIKEECGLKSINIVDVIQPSGDVVEKAASKRTEDDRLLGVEEPDPLWSGSFGVVSFDDMATELPYLPSPPSPPQTDDPATWGVSKFFDQEMERMDVPKDPSAWQPVHVRRWVYWAAKEFRGAALEPTSEVWHMTGSELCNLTRTNFKRLVSEDPKDLLWSHLQLLRKTRGAAAATTSSGDPAVARKTNPKPSVTLGKAKPIMLTESSAPNGGNRSGNNGQVQLWQFLLELLTDKDRRKDIHWIGNSGEFKLESPETVAQLWGTRKNKPNMNYEKLSRALRYYYDGDMLSKVNGKRFVYKFVCDLKNLVGYSASELNDLVVEAERRALDSSLGIRR